MVHKRPKPSLGWWLVPGLFLIGAMLWLLFGTPLDEPTAAPEAAEEVPTETYEEPRVAEVASRHARKTEALERSENLVDVGDPWRDEESLSARGRVAEAMRAQRDAEEREAARVAAAEAARQQQVVASQPTPSAPQQSAPAAPTGSVWDQLAQCESGGNWHINTGNGYYGGLQFLPATWHSVGGTGLPHEHSREEQILRGQILQQRAGWGQWPACARKLGLR